jgi:uncharacterized membrane protein
MFERLGIKPEKKNSTILAGTAYFGNLILPLLAPLIIYFISKNDRYARFHAVQSFCIVWFIHLPMALIFIALMAMQLTVEGMTFIFILLCVFIAVVINLIFLAVGIFAVSGKTVIVPYPFITDLAYKTTK